MEKILAIEEVSDLDQYSDTAPIAPGSAVFGGSFDGFKVTTDQQQIRLLIENHQSCCEDWGYFFTNDNPQDFVGAELLSLRVVDEALDGSAFEKAMAQRNALDRFKYEGRAVFVTLETSKGTLQFAAYNAHNGYYGHEVIVSSVQVSKTTSI